MSHRIKALALIFGLAVATAAVVSFAETDGSDHRVVSLKNGQVLRGFVSQAGNRFVIRLAGGGEIRVPDSDVEVVGKDIAEVYLYKRHRINPESAEDHYNLADWCLRQKLVSRAMEELEWVRQLRPRSRRDRRAECP